MENFRRCDVIRSIIEDDASSNITRSSIVDTIVEEFGLQNVARACLNGYLHYYWTEAPSEDLDKEGIVKKHLKARTFFLSIEQLKRWMGWSWQQIIYFFAEGCNRDEFIRLMNLFYVKFDVSMDDVRRIMKEFYV